ncbi:MAG: SHOCT domain-containing protein [Thermomicrobium sp.]|nr:SHOCT domain-containing protein [Thermomicrobium sp.]MDW7981495.1 SHOCT domain-containing protein [Thermomicrobium sp.]
MHRFAPWYGPFPIDPRPPRAWFWLLDFFEMVIWFAVPVTLVLVVMLVVRRLGSDQNRTGHRARAILDARYARGEITREDSLEMRRDLERGPCWSPPSAQSREHTAA